MQIFDRIRTRNVVDTRTAVILCILNLIVFSQVCYGLSLATPPPPTDLPISKTFPSVSAFEPVNDVVDTNDDRILAFIDYLGPAFQENHAFLDFVNGKVPLAILPNALEEDFVTRIRDDACMLAATGFGITAGVAGAKSKSNIAGVPQQQDVANEADQIRRNVKQIWLDTPSSSKSQQQTQQPLLIGNMDARRQLIRFLQGVQLSLEERLSAVSNVTDTSNIHEHVQLELSYLLYEPGSYYQRHVDVIQKHQQAAHDGSYRRAVSLIAYFGSANTIGSDDYDYDVDEDYDMESEMARPWDVEKDGGSLRIHELEYASLTGYPVKRFEKLEIGDLVQEGVEDSSGAAYYADIPPTPGTVVLFDSAVIPHEVLETKRSRICVVGWFGIRS